VIIFVIPKFDVPTKITYSWGWRGVRIFEEAGIKTLTLSGETATAEKLERLLRYYPEAPIFHFDHGSPSKLYGNDRRSLIRPDNIELLQGRVVYSFSCQSASRLGSRAIEVGATAWLGYKEEVGFDLRLMDVFQELCLSPLRVFSQGGTVQAAYEATQSLYQDYIDQYSDSLDVLDKLGVMWLRWDSAAFTVLGNGQARVTMPIRVSAALEDTWWQPQAVKPLQPPREDEEVQRVGEQNDKPKPVPRPGPPFLPYLVASQVPDAGGATTLDDILHPGGYDTEEQRYPEAPPRKRLRVRQEAVPQGYTENVNGQLMADLRVV
jgi:DNA-directed RNA polymerase subunit N (RpoN/RPB10)